MIAKFYVTFKAAPVAHHSRLLILKEHHRSPVYFELSGSPLRLTRLDPPEQYFLLDRQVSNVAINKEYCTFVLNWQLDMTNLTHYCYIAEILC